MSKAVQKRKVTKILNIELSADDRQKMADAAADLDAEVEEDRKQYKLVKKDWNEKIRFKEKKRSELLKAHKDGEHEVEMDAIEVMDWENRTVTYFDCADENKEILHRPMTDEETQMNFAVDDEPKTTTKRGKGGLKAVPDATEFAAPQPEDEAIGDVIKEETSRKTKRSSVDPVEAQPIQ